MSRGMDLLQLSHHHVFSDMILTQLPLEALGRLQTTCTHLQSHLKDMPEAVWVQAAHSQLPACHPVFSSLQTVQEYLRLHHDIHKTFSPSQTPAGLAQVSVSWAEGITLSPDLSKAAHVEGQQVLLTDLTTKQTLGAYPLPVSLRGRRRDRIVFSPMGKHLCIQLCPGSYVENGHPGPYPACHFIIDLEAGTVTASQGPNGGVWFCSWAPNGHYCLVDVRCPGPVDELEVARIHDTSCRCIAEARLPMEGTCRAWAPDSTAVVMHQTCMDEFQLWNLSGKSSGVKHGVLPSQSAIGGVHWSPDSSLLYCTANSVQLLCYDRQAILVQSCMLSCPASMVLGLSMQPRVGAATAVTMRCCSYISPVSDITVYTIGLGCSPAALFTEPLPDNGSPSLLCLSPDGTYLAFNLRIHRADYCEADTVLHVCSIRTRIVRVLELSFIPRGLQWTADGAGLFVLGWRQGVICGLI